MQVLLYMVVGASGLRMRPTSFTRAHVQQTTTDVDTRLGEIIEFRVSETGDISPMRLGRVRG